MTNKEILKQQKSEITEHFIYAKLANLTKNEHNKKVLKEISKDELKHYNYWKDKTKITIKPNWFKIYFYVFLTKILGSVFTLKLMERGEVGAEKFYEKLQKIYPDVKKIKKEEMMHENKLISILQDKRLTYASSIVLGLNDALVELTGTLAGLSFALGNTRLIGITGVIMGFAAAMSMAASEYLSSKEESGKGKSSIISAIYTGIAYLITVIILVTPYFTIDNSYNALMLMLILAIIIIALYTFYISVAKDKKFWKNFAGMGLISLTVAIISFGFGWLIKNYIGIDI
jgi:VIT1/CCC1 family predicted Fe2+/Mn2+ transporter